MSDSVRDFVRKVLFDLAEVSTDMVLLAMLVVVSVIVLDAITMSARKRREQSGLSTRSAAVGIDGSKRIEGKSYLSPRLGLAGKPDAVIVEQGFLIPVEHKPLAKKIRDRYVAQLLVYMRLIEECEGKRPPYGYLILGRNCRRVKIENSARRQAWLQGIIEEMHAVIEGAPTQPTPLLPKCQRCDVRASCAVAVTEALPISIGARN